MLKETDIMKNYLPLEHHKELARHAAPLLRWDGVTPIETHREVCRKKLWELLGMDSFSLCEPIFEITSEEELNGNRHIHFTLQTEEGYFTHCDLLLYFQKIYLLSNQAFLHT